MVSRSLNTPASKLNKKYVLAWLRQYAKSSWQCRKCKKEQDAGTITYERTIRFETGTEEKKQIPLRIYLCLDCAQEVLDEEMENVKLAKKGANVFKLFRDL